MSAIVSERDAERLSKPLGLLGSEHAGERAAAGAAADPHLRGLGLRWSDLTRRAFAPALVPTPPQSSDHRSRISWLLSCKGFLSSWELEFARSLHAQVRPLTVKQRAKLLEIVARVEARQDGGFSE